MEGNGRPGCIPPEEKKERKKSRKGGGGRGGGEKEVPSVPSRKGKGGEGGGGKKKGGPLSSEPVKGSAMPLQGGGKRSNKG